jgi:predicted MFS family arabinose efflux permease
MNINQQGKIIINSYVANTGMGFATILPILVGAIVDEAGFSREMIGWIASSNILGMVFGGIIATLLIGRFRLVAMLQVALFALMLFDALSIWADTSSLILSARFMSGIFGGVIYASSLAIFSGLENPLKAFGVYVVVYCAWATFMLIGLPYGITAFGVKAGFLLLVGMSIAALIGTLLIKDLEKKAGKKDFISLPELLGNKKVLIGLSAYFLMQMGGGVIWAYCERFAKEADLSSNFIGWSLGFSSLASLAGGILVMRLGTSQGLKKPLVIGTILMVLAILMLQYAAIPAVFVVSLCLIGGCWAFLIPFFQQIQTQFDASGKVVSLGTIVNMGGRATGPAIAAVVLGSSAFINVIWIGIVALILSLLLVFVLFKSK